MPDLTQARLKELLHYDPETGIFTWRARRGRGRVGKQAGTPLRQKRRINPIQIGIDGRFYRAHRLAWLYMTGEWPADEIDHRDVNAQNNKWENLRLATRSDNAANCHLRRTNTTGVKGIWLDASTGLYRARVEARGEVHYLGSYPTKQEAHAAYVAAAKQLFGEFARVA